MIDTEYSDIDPPVITKEKRKFYETRNFQINCLAFLIGIVGALSAYGFRLLIRSMEFIAEQFKLLTEFLGIPPFLPIILLPIIAGAISGPIISKWAKEAKGHGVPEVIEAVELKQGIIRPRVPFVKAGVSSVCIGFGMSLGSEGPIVQIAGGIGSYAGQKFKLKADE